MPIWFIGPTSCSQISSPVAASSAWTMLPGWTRYIVPLCTIGMFWFAPASSLIAHTQASRRSFTLSRVISLSGL